MEPKCLFQETSIPPLELIGIGSVLTHNNLRDYSIKPHSVYSDFSCDPCLPPPCTTPFTSPQTQTEPSNEGRNRQAVPSGQITRDIVFKVGEYVPPPGQGEEVVLGVDLEVGVGGHGVVDPPEPAGYKVGKEDINTVVTTGNNESTDTNQTDQKRDPV